MPTQTLIVVKCIGGLAVLWLVQAIQQTGDGCGHVRDQRRLIIDVRAAICAGFTANRTVIDDTGVWYVCCTTDTAQCKASLYLLRRY